MSSEENRKHVLIELHPREVELLKLIREKVRYGEVTIKTRDGLPFRVVETMTFHDLEPDLSTG